MLSLGRRSLFHVGVASPSNNSHVTGVGLRAVATAPFAPAEIQSKSVGTESPRCLVHDVPSKNQISRPATNQTCVSSRPEIMPVGGTGEASSVHEV